MTEELNEVKKSIEEKEKQIENRAIKEAEKQKQQETQKQIDKAKIEHNERMKKQDALEREKYVFAMKQMTQSHEWKMFKSYFLNPKYLNAMRRATFDKKEDFFKNIENKLVQEGRARGYESILNEEALIDKEYESILKSRKQKEVKENA